MHVPVLNARNGVTLAPIARQVGASRAAAQSAAPEPIVNVRLTSMGLPVNVDDIRAARYLPRMHPPIGVPWNGPPTRRASPTVPSGRNETSTVPRPIGPSGFLHDWTFTRASADS